MCASIQRQLLASAAVQQHLSKLREAADSAREHEERAPVEALPVPEPKAPKAAKGGKAAQLRKGAAGSKRDRGEAGAACDASCSERARAEGARGARDGLRS